MFPYWLDLSNATFEPLAMMLVAGLTWLFQCLGPR